ncbi:hypothetical protein, partial [Klebsiella pneumoniae]|uniref:hypothetical protein n=1 Tax=Klebsiella pneumoniae TaxID=573 RepID=UPI001C12C380
MPRQQIPAGKLPQKKCARLLECKEKIEQRLTKVGDGFEGISAWSLLEGCQALTNKKSAAHQGEADHQRQPTIILIQTITI